VNPGDCGHKKSPLDPKAAERVKGEIAVHIKYTQPFRLRNIHFFKYLESFWQVLKQAEQAGKCAGELSWFEADH